VLEVDICEVEHTQTHTHTHIRKKRMRVSCLVSKTTIKKCIPKAQKRLFNTTKYNPAPHVDVKNPQNDVVIVSLARTPIGSFNGGLAYFKAPQLGALAIRATLERVSVSKSEVQEVILGNVLSADLGQAPARQAVIEAGLAQSTVCTTINKMCASAMKSVMFAAQSIMLGHNNCMIAGGFESMTNAPYYVPKARFGYKMGDGTLIDAILKDGLIDAYNGKHMGWCAEQVASKYSITREDQDKYALESYRRSQNATKNGLFKNEIISVAVPSKGETQFVNEDEEPKNIKMDKVPTLKPAFMKEGGTITAANASTLSDGAAALLLMSEEKAKRAGLKPIARIRGFADAERDPVEFAIAPADAIPKALKNAKVDKKDISYFEINEAFSAVVLANMRILDLDPSKVNIYGGAVSLGHPIGCSGARILCTLISALQNNNETLGVASICNGGGGASSVVIELLNK
jgi:acetyl-CoA C-acetyltransferase